MQLIKYSIRPHGSFMTNWASDTLFGALCWMLVYRFGELELETFLQDCEQGNPPFVLSCAFPEGLLPRPFLPLRQERKSQVTLADLQAAKDRKRAEWVTVAAFNALRQAENPIWEDVPDPFVTSTTMHNQVGRLTNTTADGGQLFDQEETWLNGEKYPALTIYARVRADWRDRLTTLLGDLGRVGVGGRSSTGLGTFSVLEGSDCSDFDVIPDANGFVSLSYLVPSSSDPTAGYYKTIVKRGRLGEERSRGDNPFKRPLVMLSPGSAFYDSTPDRPFAGRMVDGIALGAPDALQCGLAVVLPARLS